MFFLSTFFLGFILFVQNKKNRKLLGIVASVGLICFLDEVSFGERLFDLKMFQIYGTKIDAVHDFIKLGYKVMRDHAHSYAGVIYPLLAICAIMGIIGVLKYRTELIGLISIVYSNQTYVLALFFVSLVFGAIILDLDILHIRGALVLEELFEMNAGLALLFCCLSLHKDKS